MAKKNDLKNSMSAGLTGGLDSLIQSTAGQKEAQKPKKAKTVHCNFVMDETYHQNLKLIAIRKGDSLKSAPRSRTKVRQWFNAQEMEQAVTAGREKIDKDLARLGKTAVKLEDLAKRLGFNTVDDLCLAAGKDELGQKAIENVLAPRPQKNPQEEEKLETAAPKKTSEHEKGKILVVGVDSLLTQLARCCHPVPPDEIVGFVTRGRGVTVHRADCPNIRSLDEEGRDRLIEVSWTQDESSVFPVQILVIAADRMGLLKDISEILSREKQSISAMQTVRVKGDVHMTFTIEIHGKDDLNRTLAAIREVKGVFSARRT